MGAIILPTGSTSNFLGSSTVSGKGSFSSHFISRGTEVISGHGSLGVLYLAGTSNTAGVTTSGSGALSVVANLGSATQTNSGSGSVLIGLSSSAGSLNVSGNGSMLVAYVTGSQVSSVTAANAFQLGVGINSTATSFQVGDISSNGVLLNGANGTITSTGGRIKDTTRVTTTYTILVTDCVVFANSDAGSYTVDLPAGVEGQTLRVINSGSSSNTITVDGDGTETIYSSLTFALEDNESIEITYNADDGWM
ncbi:MAG: hypothetical protein GY941_20770 [Planctomycetes bacterium]|nr:hypothetical protein [Planctomycetota bacterium]